MPGSRAWSAGLTDLRDALMRYARLTRVERGLLGDINWVGFGVFELKFRVGAGVRVYFGRHQRRLVILLCGGDKSSQDKDIRRAVRYWGDFLRRSLK